MTTNRPKFTAHDDFFFEHKKIGKVTREEFIKYIRNSHDHMRKLSEIIQQYDQTIDDYLNEWDGRFESFDEDVKDLLGLWIQDGTMDHIINENLINTKADKTYVDDLNENVTTQLAQKADKTYVDDLNENVTTQLAQITVNMKDFGAIGDGVTDDTSAIQEAMDYTVQQNGRLIGEQNKTYLIDAEISLKIPSGLNWDMTNFKLKAKPTDNQEYRVLGLHNVKNIVLHNPHILGEREEHLGEGGEWGYGISIISCQNVTIYNPSIHDCWGDGIYFGRYIGDPNNDNIKILGKAYITNCRRQGISVISAENCYIEHLEAVDIQGTAPEAALDFEPNLQHENISNFKVGRVTAIRCFESVLFVDNSTEMDISVGTIEMIDCTEGLNFYGFYQYETNANITIENVFANRLVNSSPITLHDWYIGFNPKIHIGNYFIDSWIYDGLPSGIGYGYVAGVISKPPESNWNRFGGLSVGHLNVNHFDFTIAVSKLNLRAGRHYFDGFKWSDIYVGLSQQIEQIGAYPYVEPSEQLDRYSVYVGIPNSIEALPALANTGSADEFINKEFTYNQISFIQYNANRAGVSDYPEGTTGFILEFNNGSEGIVQIAIATNTEAMYIRRVRSDIMTEWKELQKI